MFSLQGYTDLSLFSNLKRLSQSSWLDYAKASGGHLTTTLDTAPQYGEMLSFQKGFNFLISNSLFTDPLSWLSKVLSNAEADLA